jgi:FkbM family methyltransferase
MKLSKKNSLKLMWEDIFRTKIFSGSRFAFMSAKFLNYLAFCFPFLHKFTKWTNMNLFRGKKVVVRNSIGIFEVYPGNDTLNISSPYNEYHLKSWIDNKSHKDIFIDVGGNIGLYTFKALKLGYRKVIAFEPNPFTYIMLLRNLSLNNCKKVMAMNIGLGARKKVLPFYAEQTEIGSSRYIDKSLKKDGLKNANILDLEVVPFDDFVKERHISPRTISFIKIDVEGAEHGVLKGMRRTLYHLRPHTRMMIEIWDRSTKKSNCFKILNENNMRLIQSSGDNFLFEKT